MEQEIVNVKVKEYKENREKLFKKWVNKDPGESKVINHKKNVFIYDGVVCPEKWFASAIRPLFLLKEAYGTFKAGEDTKTYGGNPANWDLIKDFLLSDWKIKRVLWKRVSQWTSGLLETTSTDIAPFADNTDMSYFGNQYLKRSAVINVKKSAGQKNSHDDDVMHYAKHDHEELREQLELLAPTVIVCGSTFEFLKTFMGADTKFTCISERCYLMQLKERDIIVLHYYHPSNRYPSILNYYALMGIYQQALKYQAKERT